MKRVTSLRVGLILAICSAVFLAAFGALEVFMGGQDGSNQAKFIASFACFGFLLGGILAFDRFPDERSEDRPFARIAFGGLAGLCLGLLWAWPFEGVALAVIVASGLGYTGLAWAKHL